MRCAAHREWIQNLSLCEKVCSPMQFGIASITGLQKKKNGNLLFLHRRIRPTARDRKYDIESLRGRVRVKYRSHHGASPCDWRTCHRDRRWFVGLAGWERKRER